MGWQYFFLIIGTGILLGWLFPLVTGLVRMKKRTGGKKRLIFGGIWGTLVIFFITHCLISLQKHQDVEIFNPAKHQEGNLGKITLPCKVKSSLVLRDKKSGKQIRLNTSNGLLQAPPGEYSISSWSGTVTASDARKSKWTVSSRYYLPPGNRLILVTAGSTLELNDAVFTCFNSTPELKITTKPDLKKKGNTGIGLNIAVGDVNLDYRKEGNPVEAAIEIKTEDGKVVHKDTARIDKFSFG